MNYEIRGGQLPVVLINLEQGETIHTQAGGMSWMTDGLVMNTNAGGSIGKAFSRLFSGESVFQNTYTAQRPNQTIAVSSSFPGEILAIDVTNNTIIAQKSAFLAREEGVSMSTFFQRRMSSGFFSGEGFILQKFEGFGTVFLEIDGSTECYDLQPGESMIVSTGYLAAMEATVDAKAEMVHGFKNVFFGGEGGFNMRLTGPGKIWLQTMPKFKLASLFPSSS